MDPFTTLHATAMPLEMPNADTDQIIPARFLWRPRASGYGELLFNDLRYRPDGTPEPGFVLNDPAFAGARILVADRNFGCGSSREQAVWALSDYGFRAVIAPSFGDIFFNNCCKQGVLPVVLPEDIVAALRLAAAQGPMTVDLQTQTVTTADSAQEHFTIAPFRRRQLLEGLDEIAVTLGYIGEISAFEAAYDHAAPWLALA